MFPETFPQLLCTVVIEIVVEAIVFTVMGWYYLWHVPRKPYCLILRKEEGILHVIAKLLINDKKETVTYGKHAYVLNRAKTAYWSSHGKTVLLFVEGSAEPIQIENYKFSSDADSGKLHLLVKKATVKQLVEASKQATPFVVSVVLMVLIAAVSFMVGVFVAPYITPHVTSKTAMAVFSWLRNL